MNDTYSKAVRWIVTNTDISALSTVKSLSQLDTVRLTAFIYDRPVRHVASRVKERLDFAIIDKRKTER